MRNILFRGVWDFKNTWLYGDVVNWASGNIGIANRQSPRSHSSCYKIIPETLGQYIEIDETIGEKRKIFEEDIIRATWYSNTECMTEVVGVVKYSKTHCGYGIFDSKMYLLAGINSGGAAILEIKILGNIYDNPTLLEDLER